MRRSLPLVVVLAVAGCGGGGNDGSDVTFPAPAGTEDGKPAVKVADAAEAEQLCDAAYADWPDVYANTGEDAITFDSPGESRDLVCARPAE